MQRTSNVLGFVGYAAGIKAVETLNVARGLLIVPFAAVLFGGSPLRLSL
jgi:hypothetical protein